MKMADICGSMWADPIYPCAYGDTEEHECWNSTTCNTEHMCMCEAVSQGGTPRKEQS